ncbi:MAG: hypothetical protein WD358_01910 [Nitriliruptoraceae bacterium]
MTFRRNPGHRHRPMAAVAAMLALGAMILAACGADAPAADGVDEPAEAVEAPEAEATEDPPEDAEAAAPSGPASDDAVLRAWCDWTADMRTELDAWVDLASDGRLDVSAARDELADLSAARPEAPEGRSQFVAGLQTAVEASEGMLQRYFHPNASLDDDELLAELEVVLRGYDDLVQLCEGWGWSGR